MGHGLSSTWKYQKKNLPTICQSRQSRSQRTAKGGPNFGTRYTKWGDKGRGEIGVNLRSQSFQFPQGRPSFVFEGFFTLFLLFLWPVTYRQSTRWTGKTKTKEVKNRTATSGDQLPDSSPPLSGDGGGKRVNTSKAFLFCGERGYARVLGRGVGQLCCGRIVEGRMMEMRSADGRAAGRKCRSGGNEWTSTGRNEQVR